MPASRHLQYQTHTLNTHSLFDLRSKYQRLQQHLSFAHHATNRAHAVDRNSYWAYLEWLTFMPWVLPLDETQEVSRCVFSGAPESLMTVMLRLELVRPSTHLRKLRPIQRETLSEVTF